ncbi:MAG: molybdopterin-binding protein [Spirochaetes bacterium]|nr:molybdopterin-binding protein [Spirochaetota bacterium]
MKKVSVNEAEGMVIGHDMTQIMPGKSKGPAFRKGHVVTREDISRLLDMGKENIFVLESADGMVHEDDAAGRIVRAITGNGFTHSLPKEGKIELFAEYDGLLKINVQALKDINLLPDVMLATIHTNQRVKKGDIIAGTRIIPLIISEENLKIIEKKCADYYPVIEVKPFRNLEVGIVTTGNEVYSGRIKDGFGPVLIKKIKAYGSSVLEQLFASDSIEMITDSINSLIGKGATAIAVTGGMSVDPDDVTPAAIRKTGADIVAYGAPVLPGAMFMLAYLGDIPIMGLPGAVLYYKTTVFDLVFPRILAGERLTREDIAHYAHGGLCLNCEICKYPICGFGKAG